MKHICLVGSDNYLALKPGESPLPVSGEAVQQILLARAFLNLGYEVSTVVNPLDAPIDETVDGIRILSAFTRRSGVPVVRFIHPRATGVLRALSEVDADIYCQAPAGVVTGLTAMFCRWKHRKFIFRVASDVDCIPGRQLIAYWRDRRLFEYGLRRADHIAVQSRYQKELLAANYGLDSTVVNMAMELPVEDIDDNRDIDVLWISNLKLVKRPDRALDIAERLPDVRFTMIGGVIQGEERYYAEMEQRASRLPNVDFLGQLPYREVNEYLARSKIFLNTSDIEGFPNTFLQAWVRKVPVVSFFDPDSLISREGLGRRPSTDDEMCAALSELLGNAELRERIGEKAHAYALDHHSPESAAKQYIELCET